MTEGRNIPIPRPYQSRLKRRWKSQGMLLRRDSPHAVSEMPDCSCECVPASDKLHIRTIAAGRYGEPPPTRLNKYHIDLKKNPSNLTTIDPIRVEATSFSISGCFMSSP